jgi:hypothetical protein
VRPSRPHHPASDTVSRPYVSVSVDVIDRSEDVPWPLPA